MLADDSISTPFTQMLVIASLNLNNDVSVLNQAKLYSENKIAFFDRLRKYDLKNKKLDRISLIGRFCPIQALDETKADFTKPQLEEFNSSLGRIALSIEAQMLK